MKTMETGTSVYVIRVNNDFNQGWISNILGENAPRGDFSEAFRDGWMTAEETPPVKLVGEAIRKMRKLNQISIDKLSNDPSP